MVTTREKTLGEMLVVDNVITREQFEDALKKQEESGSSLGSILVDMNYATEWELAAALGKQLNVPFITLSHYEIDADILKSIPEDIVKKYKIVPVDKTGKTLTVALADPSNVYLLDELKLVTKCNILPVISFESDIEEAIHKYYGSDNNMDEMIKEITQQDLEIIRASEEGSEEELDLETSPNDAPVIQLVNLLVEEALKMRASDIHIEPYEKTLRVRYRIDGALREMSTPPKKMQNAIISRIKILSQLNIAERRLPQDGRFKIRKDNRNIDFRVSIIPTVFGEKVVMRILDQGALMLDMTDLGFDESELKIFEKYIRRPYGMVLITGPTGSGKSTTLYSALSTINDPKKNINTIEDPVEYQLKGINQVQVKPEIGLNFADGLRSFLRQDPDIIMVGEIRDLETAEIAIRAALTGHLVLSTLHTNDAPSTINRLANMGIESYLVTASLLMVVAQRLVRKICDRCKEEFKPTEEMLQSFSLTGDKKYKFYRGRGCDRCSGSGYRGRIAIYEVMDITDDLRALILRGASNVEIKKYAIEHNMRTLRMSGIQKVIQGVTTFDEILTITASDNM